MEVKDSKVPAISSRGGRITIKVPACRSLSEIRRENSAARFVGHADTKKLTYWNI